MVNDLSRSGFLSSVKGKAINGQLLNYFHTKDLICFDG